jgi:hypothetical protein
MSDIAEQTYWKQWTQPPTVITAIVAALTLYGGHIVQSERLEAMRARMDAIERDYQRRDVLAERLLSIDQRLFIIEQKLSESETAGSRPGQR